MKSLKALLVLLCSSSILSVQAHAQTKAADAPSQAEASIQQSWDQIKYQTPDKNTQIRSIQELEARADSATSANPASADLKIWAGIVYATDAGLNGGISALSKVKKAKSLFEQALAIDEKAMNGGAHTSLGSLYYQVPGWPLAFGDDAKAEEHLKAALAISPEDIDANYFYGDYLVHKKRYGEAIPVLEKALKAPARPGRQIADAGRKGEIKTDLNVAKKDRYKSSYN
jgi:tetratricopeptide (TPR) repeat protein